jgi:RHS repeat-associated protein
MKFAKLTLIFSLFCLYQISIFAQTQPNLENGFKPYGTYGGSDIDSINLSNGNLIVHIPMPFTFPQRGGKLSPKMVVRMSSKAWAVSTFLAPNNGGHSNYWNLGFGPSAHIAEIGTGVGLDSTLDLSLHRYYEIESGPTSGYHVGGYYITTWDGGTHQLHAPSNAPADSLGTAMSFDAIDQSDYHVDLSTPDPDTGIPTSGVIIDREGNRYQISGWATSCGKPSTTGQFTGTTQGILASDPFASGLFDLELYGTLDDGGYISTTLRELRLLQDTPIPASSTVGSTSFTTCTQAARISNVTDVNGNVIYSSNSSTPGDTMGRQPDVLGNITSTTDFTGCVSTNPSSPVNGATIYSYQGKGDVTNQVKLCMANYSVQTNFGISGIAEAQNAPTPVQGSLAQPLIVTVVFSDPIVGPNFTGSRWTFNYDSYINLTDIGLPTGGSIHYDWGQAALPHCGSLTPVSRVVVRRTTNDNRGNISQTNYFWGTPSGGVMSNTVSDPLGNDTMHVFTSLDGAGGCLFYETSTKSYQGAQGSGSLLRQVDTTYQTPTHFSDAAGANGGFGNILPTIVKTTITQNGQTKISQVTRTYDQGPGNTRPSIGDVVTEQVTDWDGSTILRQVENAYQWQQTDANGNQPYLSANLIGLPARSVVKNAGGCMVAETTYGYDEFSLTPSGMGPTQHLNTAPNSVRGNQTSVNRWLSPLSSGNCIQAPALTAPVSVPTPAISSHTKWFDSGIIAQAIDPLGHTTTFSTDLAYLGTYVTETCSPTTSGSTHCVSGTFDFNTGLITSFTNENATSQAYGTTPGDNAHTSFYTYDNMFRLISAQAPPDPNNGGLSNTNNFNFSAPNVFPITAQRVKSVTGPPSDSRTSLFDGLGRSYKTQRAVPGNLATVDTTFDLAGNTASVSNPYFSTSDPTYGTTSSSFDAFARPTTVIKQDGSISSVSYNVAASSAGMCNDAKDEAGTQRRACSDALGRLVEVDEPNANAPATAAHASITINGFEQTNPLPALGGTGAIIISGAEGTSRVCNDAQPPHQVCRNVPDGGTIGLKVGTYTPVYVTYGPNSNGTTLASAMQQSFHNDPSSPVDATIDPSNSTKINFAARGTGAATNYPLAFYNDVDFSVNSFGGLTTLTGGRDGSTNPDSGTVTITINGTAYSITYGGSDTQTTIASRLASAITAGTFANASTSANVITLTAKSTGPGSDYSLSASSTYDSVHFAGPSFTTLSDGGIMTNGYDAAGLGNQSFITQYQYDALGNLLRVDQKGSAPSDSTQWRTRTFTYDSLSRLLTATNPESGTISYVYDADGNLLQKTSPAPNQTGTATQTVSFCYDELHRVTGKGYGVQSCPLTSPVVSYGYDSGANAKGKLVSLTDQAGTGSYTYDVLGRLTTETRMLYGAGTPPPGTDVTALTKTLSYAYNLDGSLKALNYPSGGTVTYTPDSAGRVLSAIDNLHSINYATGASYGADNSLTGFISGYSGTFAGITNAFAYNKRLQPLTMSATAPSQTVYSIGYDFHAGTGTPGSGTDNGNVWGITNYKDTSRNQAFTYDLLNRLTSAQNAGTDCTANILQNKSEYWGNSYGYDGWGNMLQKSITKCGAEHLSVTADAHNWIHSSALDYQYDAAGNMTYDATASLSYTFDQENRLTGAGGYTYTYDGDGNRVSKSNGTSGILYWYMTPGIVEESDLAGNMTSEYVFFAGDRVARRDVTVTGLAGSTPIYGTTGISYYFSDHLKTASVVTDSAGVIKAESDYYPWGGELQFINDDSNHYKFTGKERDSETGLDYFGARYYSNGLGRWVSADWSPTPVPVPYADLGDPQSLNLYGYVRNIPTTKSDPDGHCPPCPWDGLPVDKKGDIGEALKGAWNRLVTLDIDIMSVLSGGQVGFTPGGRERLQPQNTSQRVGAQALDAATILVPVLGEEMAASRSTVQIVDMTINAKLPSVITEGTAVQEGSFSIIDWRGYPEGLPKPDGPFRLLEGAEYTEARAAANSANRQMHAADPALNGMQIHEIQPVKFGGSPTDPANKVPLPPAEHAPATTWWNRLQRDLMP